MSSSPVMDARMPRLDALTGLRWYAALFVFGYHMLVFAPLPGVTKFVLSEGFYGVTFFFVLSGFVLTWSASPRVSKSTFYWRRFARVWPAHIIALVIAIPVFFSVDPDPADTWVKPLSIGLILLSVVLLQGWWLNPAILFSGNPAAWTLTCEAFFYALHPYLLRILRPFGTRGALVFVVVLIVIMFGYRTVALESPGAWFAALPLPVVRVTEFAIGMGIAWAIRAGWRPRIPAILGIASLVAVILVLAGIQLITPPTSLVVVIARYSNELVTVACAVAIVAVAVHGLTGRRSLLASRVHVRLGEWSFAFYLVHATLIYIALTLFGPQDASWRNLLWFGIMLIIATGTAAALHELVEKPVERRLRRWKDERAARATTDTSDAER